MSRTQGNLPDAAAVRPFGLWRAWLRTLVLTEAVMAALFAACTVWLAISSPTESPLVTPVVRRIFTWYTVKYSAWVFLGYMLIGLVMATTVWAVLSSWAYLRNRALTRRGLTASVTLTLAAILGYELVSLSVLDPQVVGNTFTGVSGVWLIGVLGDVVPAWLVLGVRYGVPSLATAVVLAAAVRALARAKRSTRIAALAVVGVALVTVAGVGLRLALQKPPPSTRDPHRPNILILASDGLQKEHLSLYGYPRRTSPHIDRLGRDAVRFDQCYVPVARTLGSWASILTSTYPHTHNFRQTWPRETRLEVAQPTLCRELKKLGYSSYVFSDWAGSDFGKVDYGFDTVVSSPEAWSLSVWIGVATCRAHPLLVSFGDNWLGHRMYPEMKGMPVNPDPQSVTRRTVKELERLSLTREPFFMVTFYSETHLPYSTRYPYYKKFTDPQYEGNHKMCVYMPDPRQVARGEIDPEESFDVDQVRGLYDGAVLSFDDQVGEVLEALHELDLWDDTIVVVMSDHGEDLMETPGAYGHGNSFDGDDFDSRIPLVISDPLLRGRGERVVGDTVSSLDLMPTLLARLDAPTPATCKGTSLLSLVEGRPQVVDNRIFAETEVLMGGGREFHDDQRIIYPPLLDMLEVSDIASGQVGVSERYVDLLVQARQRMIRTDRWKLVYTPLKSGARYELFDIQQDPSCRHDVKESYPDVTARLKGELWGWMKQDERRHEQGEHLLPIPQAQ
jgi:arylsulfatase A-like enzyme